MCTVAGCEYGDKATWCATVGVSASRCTPSDLGDQCCETCQNLVPGGVQAEPAAAQPAQTNADCPSGDTAGYCATIASSNCYHAAQQCCISCAKYKTNIPGMLQRRTVVGLRKPSNFISEYSTVSSSSFASTCSCYVKQLNLNLHINAYCMYCTQPVYEYTQVNGDVQ